MLDFAALARTPLSKEPFDHVVVPNFVLPEACSMIAKDYPKLERPANHPVQGLEFGPVFADLIEALEGPLLADAMSDKFGVDLRKSRTTITVRGHSQASDGSIHTDAWAKLVTAIVYFNEDWQHGHAGSLRLLRSPTDLEDYEVEVAPLMGTLVAFRRGDHSYHGHYPFEGERRMLQLSWLQSSRAADFVLGVKRLSTKFLKRFGMDRPNASAQQ